MVKLNLPKRKYRKYKRKTYYLKQVYKLNKERIDSVFDNPYTTSEKAFIQAVKETKYDYNLQYKVESTTGRRKVSDLDALKYLFKKETFRSEAERFADNLLSGIKNDKNAYANLRKIIGSKHHIKYENLHWSKEERAYFYDFETKMKNKDGDYYKQSRRVAIYLENSPKQIIVREVEI